MTTPAAKFGTLVRTSRKSKGLKAWQVAEKVEIDAKHLGRIERGEKQPSFDLIIALARVLDVSPSKLFEFDVASTDHKTVRKQIDTELRDRNDRDLQRAREVLKLLFER